MRNNATEIHRLSVALCGCGSWVWGRAANPLWSRRGRPAALALLCLLLIGACSHPSERAVYFEAFQALEKVKEQKRKQVIDELNHLLTQSSDILGDEDVIRAFKDLRDAPVRRQSSRSGSPQYESLLDRKYVEEYFNFYDILFVSSSGDIFYTVRRESDYRDNLFHGRIADTRLSRALRQNPAVRFVDYDYYAPSKESAAFFIAAVQDRGVHLGWIVLQFSINTINAILDVKEDLGQTGEVYLVNNEKLMITDSRFLPHVDTPERTVETPAAEKAIAGVSGMEVIEDYRGVRVLSCYDRFDFQNTSWAIVAEIDEDEVITQHFVDDEGRMIDRIYSHFHSGKRISSRDAWLSNPDRKTDINEYTRVNDKEIAATYGITTCTGVFIYNPARFTYLGHLYPLDSTYYSDSEAKLLDTLYRLLDRPSGRRINDLLSSMMSDIKRFDTLPHEIRDLHVVLVAVHLNSFKGIIDRLIDEGLFLSQITILYDPNMTYAHAVSQGGSAQVAIQWVNESETEKYWSTPKGAPSLGAILKSHMDRN